MRSYTCTEVIVAKLLLCDLFANVVFSNCFLSLWCLAEGLAEVQAIRQKEFPAGVKMRHHQYLPLRKNEVHVKRILPLVLAQCVHQRNGNKGVSQPAHLLKIRRGAVRWQHRTCQPLCKPFCTLCLAKPGPPRQCNPAMLKWRRVQALPETMFLVSY